MLRNLHLAFTGQPDKIDVLVSAMTKKLKPLAKDLIGTRLKNGLNAAPTFELA